MLENLFIYSHTQRHLTAIYSIYSDGKEQYIFPLHDLVTRNSKFAVIVPHLTDSCLMNVYIVFSCLHRAVLTFFLAVVRITAEKSMPQKAGCILIRRNVGQGCPTNIQNT